MIPLPYAVHYTRRRGRHSWCIPISTSARFYRAPFVAARHTPAWEGDEESARRFADRLNGSLRAAGIPGKCFAVLARDLTQAEVEAIGRE